MARKVTPPPTGIWKLILRAQRTGLREGMAGRGGSWLALGIGAWGLRRVRDMAVRKEEILLSEPLRPGERIVITHETTTRAQAKRSAKKAAQRQEQEAKAATRRAKAAKKAHRALPRRERKALERAGDQRR